jgi:hypothetical protein
LLKTLATSLVQSVEYENHPVTTSFGEDLGEDSEEIDGSLVGVSHLQNIFWYYGCMVLATTMAAD